MPNAMVSEQYNASTAASAHQLILHCILATAPGTVIDSLIHKYYSSSSSSDTGGSRIQVLDCACGVGTQVIGLAAQAGYAITATDLSSAAGGRLFFACTVTPVALVCNAVAALLHTS